MKVLWTLAGILLLGGIIAVFWISNAKQREMEGQAVAFTSDAVTDISDGWKPEAFRTRAEPGLVNAMASQGQGVGMLFGVYSKLGSPSAPPVCTFKDSSDLGTGDKRYTTATVTCDEQFGDNPASFLITLRRAEDAEDWKIYYIRISSPAFPETP